MRYFVIFLVSFFSIPLSYAQKLNGKIIDANTKKPVPFVSIGLIGSNKMIASNDFGEFELNLTTLPTKLRFSHVTYKTFEQTIKNSEDIIIELIPAQLQLGVLNIEQLTGRSLLTAALNEFKLRENEMFYGNAFSRITHSINNEPYYLSEVFLDVKMNPKEVVGWIAKQNRYANFEVSTKSIQISSNYEFAPILNKEIMSPAQLKDYEITTQQYIAHEEQRIAVIFCKYVGKSNGPYTNSIYYVGMNNHKIYRVDIGFQNLYIPSESNENFEMFPMQRTITIIFAHFNSTVPLIQSIATKMSIDLRNSKGKNKVESNTLFLFYELNETLKDQKYNEKSKAIKQTKPYDLDFWKNNPIIRQTPLEENFTKVIESKSAFGKQK
ncbi:carboxypeptidase-like regulatory domain-containing protein [Pedobacter sp.]